MDWLDVLYKLQQKWNVWTHFKFLDPDSLTAQQKQAIACEAINEQDCTSRSDMCLPSIADCPDAYSILNELDVLAQQQQQEEEEEEDQQQHDDDDEEEEESPLQGASKTSSEDGSNNEEEQ
jgi:hypothetical protein